MFQYFSFSSPVPHSFLLHRLKMGWDFRNEMPTRRGVSVSPGHLTTWWPRVENDEMLCMEFVCTHRNRNERSQRKVEGKRRERRDGYRESHRRWLEHAGCFPRKLDLFSFFSKTTSTSSVYLIWSIGSRDRNLQSKKQEEDLIPEEDSIS